MNTQLFKNDIITSFDLLYNYYNYKLSLQPKYGTLKNYKAYFSNLSNFEQLHSIRYENINQQFINQLCCYLLNGIDSTLYLKRNIAFLKASYTHAYNLGEIGVNPFSTIQLPKGKFERRTALTASEVRQLFSNYDTLGTKLQRVCDVANFQVHTGLAYCDLKRVCKRWLLERQGNLFLVGNRKKTETEFCIPLKSEVYNYLVSVGFNVPVMSNQKYNCYLKELARVQGIKRKLTSHDLRVTFGQLQLNNGYSMEAVSRMMGHEKITTTMKYYAKTSKELVMNEVLSRVTA